MNLFFKNKNSNGVEKFLKNLRHIRICQKFFASKSSIEEKISKALKIENLEVIDTSGNCGTSFKVIVTSPDFIGQNTISQHRMINDILKEDLKDIHALQLKTEASKL